VRRLQPQSGGLPRPGGPKQIPAPCVSVGCWCTLCQDKQAPPLPLLRAALAAARSHVGEWHTAGQPQRVDHRGTGGRRVRPRPRGLMLGDLVTVTVVVTVTLAVTVTVGMSQGKGHKPRQQELLSLPRCTGHSAHQGHEVPLTAPLVLLPLCLPAPGTPPAFPLL